MVAEEFDQFGDELGFVFTARAGVTPAHLDQHFLTCVLTHLGVHGSVTPNFESTGAVHQPRSPASVTIFLSQIAHFIRSAGFLTAFRTAIS
jgi:hypothetical protein